MQLNINTDAVVVFTNKLEKMHRSALPNAVRGALNKAAFNVKQDTMLKSAKSEFKQRSPNFFKANSKVDMAKGWDMRSMKATVGFTEQSLRGSNNYAVKDLEQQEHGGTIRGRSFIAYPTARIGNNALRTVSPRFRLGKMNNVVDAWKAQGKSKKQKFVKSAIKAKQLYGDGAFVLGNVWKGGSRTLSKIDEVSSNAQNRKLVIKRTPLYTFKKGRTIKVSGTNFMKRASLESGLNIERFFVLEAIRQIKKLQG